jgi:hypothetical protein
VKLNPNSSDAHWLLSDLLGKLIPHVLGEGPRIGPESTREADQAIELDPRNAPRLIARAFGYFFTPSVFGGGKPKAMEMLKKAVDIDPASDAADTAHILLAQVYFGLGQRWTRCVRSRKRCDRTLSAAGPSTSTSRSLPARKSSAGHNLFPSLAYSASLA